ncbi:hypothetical protein [Streptomyces sp. NPDC057336]|uniref:hypothetical protein n=1 Tax=Streptomyces sp. NPDC057336 TaxID=3346102 RepID=UPI00362B8380
MAVHTPPSNLGEALDSLANLMDAHPGPIGYVALAALMSRAVDGPAASAWKPVTRPDLGTAMTQAILPNGYLSSIPTADEVRRAARAA